MRIRSLVIVPVVALAMMGLSSCSSDASPNPSASGSALDLCLDVAPSTAQSDSIEVTGEFGQPASVKFEAPMTIDTAGRTVVTEGSGEKIKAGDLVSYALTAFNTENGEKLGASGYDNEALPQPITAGTPLAEILGCATVGTRVVAALPAEGEIPADIFVVDLLGVTPQAAWGAPQDSDPNAPVVVLDETGAPTITIPEGDAPDELQVFVLKEGDGAVVAEGDTSLLQYSGVAWDTGEEFDSSWSRGVPMSSPSNQYIEGFTNAITGQKVGSQILMVIPAEQAYTSAGNEDNPLYGKDLVFVVDILATSHPQVQSSTPSPSPSASETE